MLTPPAAVAYVRHSAGREAARVSKDCMIVIAIM